jgi:hypothetical protein
MSKKNFNNVKDQLTEQAKQRFTPSDNDNGNYSEHADSNQNKERKQQKTIYLDKAMTKLLKKAAYIQDLDQSEIVAIALEKYFESEKIYLENGK